MPEPKHQCADAELCGEFLCALCQETAGNCHGASDDFPELCDTCAVHCVYCGKVAEGNYSFERDVMLLGNDVPICDACGESSEPTAEQIWCCINDKFGPFEDYGDDAMSRRIDGRRPRIAKGSP